jgi:hypothetical protein
MLCGLLSVSRMHILGHVLNTSPMQAPAAYLSNIKLTNSPHTTMYGARLQLQAQRNNGKDAPPSI